MRKIIFLIAVILLIGCDKDQGLPTASIPEINSVASVTNITNSSASSGGNIISVGGAIILARGVCWATISNPTIVDSRTNDIGGIGIFISQLTGLLPSTTYYVRAYATNSVGTRYSPNQMIFTTLSGLPTLTTTALSSITSTTAISGGNITNSGASTVTAKGVCWSTAANPTIASPTKTVGGTGTGIFSSSITGLNPNTIYHVRAYATNSSGTAYGADISFTTLSLIPSLTTSPVTGITTTTAISGGEISDNGGAAVTVRGVCWSTSVNPTTGLSTKTSNGSGSGSFSSSITGLTTKTSYHVRSYATNAVGTAYGQDILFTTN